MVVLGVRRFQVGGLPIAVDLREVLRKKRHSKAVPSMSRIGCEQAEVVVGLVVRMGSEPAGEDLAVVGEDLAGNAVALQRLQQRLAHRPGRRPYDQLGDHAEPRVVVDPGDHLALGAVFKCHPAHHVHLPQLHRPGALPSLVVLGPAPAGLVIDQPVADQAAVDRRAGGRLVQLPAQLGPMVLGPQPGWDLRNSGDPGLDLRRRLVRAPVRPRAALGEGTQAFARVTNEPSVDGPTIDAVAGGDVGDLGALERLSHREVALLNPWGTRTRSGSPSA